MDNNSFDEEAVYSKKLSSGYKEEINKLVEIDANIIIISNEIGMGLHANSESGRKFTQLQGWTNQHIAKLADKAIFMVSGLPLILK